jgi:AraC family transcriptional regulator
VANHQEAAREWSSRPGITSASLVASALASASLIEIDNHEAQNGEWYSKDVHYIDMCLGPRPRSLGCFVASSNEYHSAGRIFLAPAGHRIRFQGSPGRQQNLALFLSATALDGEPTGLVAPDEALWRCLNIWSESIRTPLRRIAAELRRPDFASPRIVEGLSLVILGEFSRLLQQPRPKLGAAGGLAAWRLNLIEEMARNDQTPPTVVDLAKACRISPRHLMRAFRSETGQTLAAYVGAHAMERAKGMLRDTDVPIAQIGREVGFATPAGFSAAFRRHTGAAPRDFRVLMKAMPTVQ